MSCSAPAGWVRDEVVVANKLWWEFWPEQTRPTSSGLARADGARPRRSDLRHAAARDDPRSVAVREVVESAAGLIASGMARQWASACGRRRVRRGGRHRLRARVLPPVANQLACSLVQQESTETRRWSADDEPRRRSGRVVRARRRNADREVHRRTRPAGRATTTPRRTAPASGSPSRSPTWRVRGM